MEKGARHRARRAHDGGQAQGGGVRDVVRQEVRNMLMTKPRGMSGVGAVQGASGMGWSRKPEWKCPCGTFNFMDRALFRRCGYSCGYSPGGLPGSSNIATARLLRTSVAPQRARGSSGVTQPGDGSRILQGSVLKTPKTPAARAQAWTEVPSTARALGASEETAGALLGEAAVATHEAADARPLGVRLDSCKARLKKGELKLVSAEMPYFNAYFARIFEANSAGN